MAGKSNIVAQRALVRGDLRFLSAAQKEEAKAKMRAIVARHLPRTSAELRFPDDGYPAMEATPENYALLRQLDAVSRDLGYGEAQAYVPFRGGVALVDVRGQLVLVTPEEARSVLARASGAVPALGPRGELAYVARYDDQSVEVHTLGIDGRDRVVARGLGSAGLLAPQPDGRVVFVATPARGGVAGVWIAAEGGGEARCLTNCGLQTGSAALDSRFIPLPGDAASIALAAERVSWHASDGTIRSVSLAVPPAPPDAPTNVDALGGPR